MPLLERCFSLLVRVATSPRPAVLAAAGACALFRPAKAEVCAALMASGHVPAPSRTLDLSVVVACHRMLDCAAILLFCPFAVCALSHLDALAAVGMASLKEEPEPMRSELLLKVHPFAIFELLLALARCWICSAFPRCRAPCPC